MLRQKRYADKAYDKRIRLGQREYGVDRDSKRAACSRAAVHEETTLTLAPAAGVGVGKAVADDLLARPGFAKRLADALERGLSATRRTWDSGSKQWVEEPDTRSQLQAAFGIMAHMEGEPVKRIIHQHLGGAGTVDPLGALRESEALRDAAKAMLEKAEWRTSGNKAYKRPKQAQPVEADTV